MKPTISSETRDDALKIAKATQKPGQTKEQTKLIAQGIEKGIAEYKKQQKIKARSRDKAKKQQQKLKIESIDDVEVDEQQDTKFILNKVPLALLIISWLCFVGAYFLIH